MRLLKTFNLETLIFRRRSVFLLFRLNKDIMPYTKLIFVASSYE